MSDMSIAAVKVYVAGPMSGLPNFNYDAFFGASELLRDIGALVTNPAENGLPQDAPWEQHMRVDLCAMLLCDRVVTLPGWERSRGASLEVRIARELGMGVANFLDTLADPNLLTPLSAPRRLLAMRKNLRQMLLDAPAEQFDSGEGDGGFSLEFLSLKMYVADHLGIPQRKLFPFALTDFS